MMGKRIFGLLAALAIVGGALAKSKKTDPDTLARVGEVVGQKVKSAMPDANKVAGPIVAFKPGDALPLEEKVRLRIRTDKKMEGAEVTVLPGSTPGEIKLRGVVPNAAYRQRAGELAEGTAGVEKVLIEIAVPE